MSTAQQWANIDLANGLAGASTTDDLQVDNTLSNLLTTSITKQEQLQQAKQDKLNILQSKIKNPWETVAEPKAERDLSKVKNNQYGNLENTTTVLPDGEIESNANKVWNNYSSEQLQMKIGDTIGNHAVMIDADGSQYQMLPDGNGNLTKVKYDGPTRRFYAYQTKDDNSDVIKFGLSTSRHDSSDARYDALTGWESGPKGVDTKRKVLDVLLPYDKATELEGIIHGNDKAIAQRVVKSSNKELRNAYGSGASEYYSSIDNVLVDVSGVDLRGVNIPNVTGLGTKSMPAELPTRGIGKQIGDFTKAFIGSFAKTAVVDVADAVVEGAGYVAGKDWDLGTNEEKSAIVDKALNYNNKYANAVGIKLQKLGEQVTNADSTTMQRIEAIAEGAKIAFTNVDTMGTSLGTLAAWVTPGKLISKIFTVGKEVGATVAAIDAAVDAGTMTTASALIEKAKVLGTAEGIMGVGINQIGHVTAAAGAVNNQYDAFVENNGGKEPTDKLKWFAERFSLQMLNQNLDAITDISVLKSPGLIALGKDLMKTAPEKGAKAVATKVGMQIMDLVAIQAPKEAIQEYTQEMMEMWNEQKGSIRYSNLDTFTKFVTDQANMSQAMGAAIGGAGGAGQFKAMGIGQTALSKAGTHVLEDIQKEKTRRNDAKIAADDKPTDDELDFMSTTLAGIDAGTLDLSSPKVLEDLYKTESIFNRQKASAKNPEVVKEIEEMLSSTKAKILSQLDNDVVPTLGSKEAEDYIDFVMTNTPDILNSKRLNKLELVAKASGVEEYFKQAKNYFEVEKEAVEGPRGWKTYERDIKYALETAESNPDKLKAALTKSQKYLTTQERYVNILESAIEEAELKAKQSKEQTTGIVIAPKSIKVKELETLTGKPYTIHFTDKGDVHPAVYTLLETKKRNVQGLIDALTQAGDYMVQNKIKSPANVSGGIYVPDVTTGKASDVKSINAQRAKDRAYYTNEEHTVTKVITDFVDSKWNKTETDKKRLGDYYTHNKTRVNRGNYNKSDVVLLNVSKLEDDKLPKAVAAELSKAINARATILLDTGMYNNKEVYKSVFLQLTKYTKKDNKYGAVLTKKGNAVGSYMFKPKEQADAINADIKAKAKAKKEAEAAKTKVFDNELLSYAKWVADGSKGKFSTTNEYVDYFNDKTDSEGNVTSKAVRASKYLQKMYLDTVNAGAEVLTKQVLERTVSNDVDTDEDRHEEALKAVVNNVDDIVVEEIKSTGYNKISSKVLKDAVIAEVVKRITEYKESFANLAKWAELQSKQHSTEGLTAKEYKEEIKKLGFNAKDFENSLKDTIANKVEEKNGKRIVVKKAKLGGDIEQSLNLHVVPLDYMSVSNTTVLNSVSADLLLQHPVLGPKIVVMQENLKKVVNTDKGINWLLADAPGVALVFDENGEVNVNVAAAMVVGMENFYKANSYMLSGGVKSVADIARMLHQDEDKVTPMMRTMLQDKGMFGKSMASQIGKNIAGLLGISKYDKDNAVEKMRFTQAITDVAHMAMHASIAAGELERDASVTYKELLEAAGEAQDDLDSKGLSQEKLVFFKLKNDDMKEELAGRYDDSVALLPIEEFYRKEPLLVKPSDKHVASKLEKIRNDKLGQEIPAEAKKALTKAMNTEYKVESAQLNDILNFADDIKAFMGYKDEASDEFKKLHELGKEEQLVINREVNKEFDELVNLQNKIGDKDKLSMWFDFYYSTNGRYFYDSNTINPGTMKQLVRWLVQPAKHHGEVTFSKEDGKYTFKKNGKNVTNQMMFAIGQALGAPVDKKRIATSVAVVTPLLDVLLDKENPVDFDAMFKQALKKQKVQVGDGHIEIEHVAHMRQAFLMLKDLRDNGKAMTSLSAEFDAKTSGFGLKTAMMPIDDNALDSLQKTGQSVGKRKSLADAIDTIGDDKAIYDAYQSLAKGMNSSKSDLEISDIAPTSAFAKAGTTVKWSNFLLLNMLPASSDTISSALRNLFKQPFMEFNYSAGMRAIRRSLAYTIARQIVDEVAYADNKAEVFKKYGLSNYFSSVANFSKMLTDPHMESNKGYESLVKDVDIMFGSQVQHIFESQFPKAIQAQGVINQAFKAMFALYKVAYDKEIMELRKAGTVTEEGYIKVLVKLHKMFPWIKGPLSQEGVDKDGIAIYKIKTSGAPGAVDAGLTSQIAIREDYAKKHGMVNDVDGKVYGSATIGLEMARFEAAMNAGAVVPIHYIDGALLAKLVNEYKGDLTIIHDAKIPAIEDAFDTTELYNKALYEIAYGANRYRLVSEIKKALNRVQSTFDKGGYKATNVHNITTYTSMYGTTDKEQKKSTITPTEYVKLATEQIELLEADVEAKIGAIQKEIAENGIKMDHMFSGGAGMFVVKGKAETKVKDDIMDTDMSVDNPVDYVQERIAPWIELDDGIKGELSKITNRNALDKLIEDINCRKG